MVETEFAGAMYPDDPARAEVIYASAFDFHFDYFLIFKAAYKAFPCLQSEDIADSVMYILSAPKHVQVC